MDTNNTIVKTQDNTSFVIYETSKANSVEMGKAGNRFKLYFDTAEDLKKLVENLKINGFYPEQTE
jgi:hypothetical protein